MDVLHSLEGFLPQLHLDGTVQLNQASVKMHGLGLRVVQIDGTLLVLMLMDVAQMHAQIVTQLAEFRFSGVLQAELEGCEAQLIITTHEQGRREKGRNKRRLTITGNVLVQLLHA